MNRTISIKNCKTDLQLQKERYSQEEIIQGCINNNRFFQELLYDKMSGKMFSVCLRYAEDYHTAEDILQEGFIKVFKNIQKYRGEGSFEGWVRRIFINTSIENYRKASRMYPVQEQERIDYEYFDESTLDGILADDLLKLIQSLTPGYKAVFNMYVIEGFTHKEISDRLGISEGTSKSQLARARYILQKKVASTYKVAAELGS